MYKVNVNRHLLVERRRLDEIRILAESFVREVSEAVAQSDIQNILGKYLAKVKDPNARNDFLMQAASFLGRKSAISPDELDQGLRQHYAKNYDPAKLARGQTPGQKASQQSKAQPPPLPQQAPKKQTAAQPDKPSAALPSLSSLAGQEFASDWQDYDVDKNVPVWKKHGLPDPDTLQKSADRGNPLAPSHGDKPEAPPTSSKAPPPQTKSDKPKQKPDEEIPTANPDDVKSVVAKKKKAAPSAPQKSSEDDAEEVDMDKFGAKTPDKKEKPAKSEPSTDDSSKKKKQKAGKKKTRRDDLEDVSDEDETSQGKDSKSNVPLPSFSSIVKPKMAAGADLGDPKWKVGDTVDIGHAGDGYKVKNRTGSWYNLEKNGQKYVFIPFKGLRKIR